MRKRVLFLFVLLWGCSNDDTPATSSTVNQLPDRESYPGASFALDMPGDPEITATADRGEIAFSSDSEGYRYVAPFETGADNYRIFSAADKSDADKTVLAKGSVTTVLPPAAELELTSIEPGKQVVASYGDVQIKGVFEGDIATATFTHGASGEQLRVNLNSDGRQANLVWQNLDIDGYGALTDSESAALHTLATGPLARAVTMAALDLGCIDRPFEIPAEVYAALLFPWQMILKYEVSLRDPVVEHFLSASRCAFPGHMPPAPEKPQNIAVLWDADHSVPMIHEAFPFDGDGQAPRIAP